MHILIALLDSRIHIIFEWQYPWFTCSGKGECSVMVGVGLLVNINGRLKGAGREGIQIVGQVGVWGVDISTTKVDSIHIERYCTIILPKPTVNVTC